MQLSSSDLETVACDLCDDPNGEKIFTRPDGLDVQECRSCGLAFVNPRPLPALLSRLYEEGYFGAGTDRPGVGYSDHASAASREQLLELAGTRLETIHRHAGALARYAQRAGFEVVAIATGGGSGGDVDRRTIEVSRL